MRKKRKKCQPRLSRADYLRVWAKIGDLWIEPNRAETIAHTIFSKCFAEANAKIK